MKEKNVNELDTVENVLENEQVLENAENKKVDTSDFIKTALSTGEKLKKQSKIRISIPKSELNQGDDYVVVAINGYKYKIKRGEEVEVPKSVYNLLKVGKYI